MTVEEAWQRGNNLLPVGLAALAGISFIPELFAEDEWLYKLDDGLVALLGIAAIVWYLQGRNRFMRSWVPSALVAASFVVKVVGLILEIGDAADAGDDFGSLWLYLLGTITVIVLYVRGRSAPQTGA